MVGELRNLHEGKANRVCGIVLNIFLAGQSSALSGNSLPCVFTHSRKVSFKNRECLLHEITEDFREGRDRRKCEIRSQMATGCLKNTTSADKKQNKTYQ